MSERYELYSVDSRMPCTSPLTDSGSEKAHCRPYFPKISKFIYQTKDLRHSAVPLAFSRLVTFIGN